MVLFNCNIFAVIYARTYQVRAVAAEAAIILKQSPLPQPLGVVAVRK